MFYAIALLKRKRKRNRLFVLVNEESASVPQFSHEIILWSGVFPFGKILDSWKKENCYGYGSLFPPQNKTF